MNRLVFVLTNDSRSKRPVILPNDGFYAALCALEKELWQQVRRNFSETVKSSVCICSAAWRSREASSKQAWTRQRIKPSLSCPLQVRCARYLLYAATCADYFVLRAAGSHKPLDFAGAARLLAANGNSADRAFEAHVLAPAE